MHILANMFSLLSKHGIKKLPLITDEEYKLLQSRLERELELPKPGPVILLPESREILSSIRKATRELNLNNVTRTNAYLNYYVRNPEVHWAFLAHMVSRNGGYHMTDLKGSAMDHLLSEAQKEKYFLFLEEANSAIFSDAYPQLLLYEYGKKQRVPHREILSLFSVSPFMAPVWEQFRVTGSPALLTAALIINEQRMLQARLLSQGTHAKILGGLDFQLQEFFGFTTVVFPYSKGRERYKLSGLAVRRFAEPAERIAVGKKLYAILFDKKIYPGALEFARGIRHTASRADYWGGIFSRSREDGQKLYSPGLSDAWSNISLPPLKPSGWFTDKRYIEELKWGIIPVEKDITKKVMENLKVIQTLNEWNDVMD
ncbi:DUF2515 family protein [Peribacillus sp. SCS-37]|uniref:DUF2515 family protein n=1 Tax=Paraperibacillus esterisolvens TaxID=3115296 RepID=UPI00390576D4